MAKKTERNIITGLDIGTSKVVALVGEINPDGSLELIGIGRHASRGLKRGVVVDIEATVSSIQRAVQEAELMAGCEVRSVFTSTSCRPACGSHHFSVSKIWTVKESFNLTTQLMTTLISTASIQWSWSRIWVHLLYI